MKQTNSIIASVVILSLFSGSVNINVRIYLFILLILKRKILFEVEGGERVKKGRGRGKESDKTTSTTSIRRELIQFQFLTRIEEFSFIDVFRRKEDEV